MLEELEVCRIYQRNIRHGSLIHAKRKFLLKIRVRYISGGHLYIILGMVEFINQIPQHFLLVSHIPVIP